MGWSKCKNHCCCKNEFAISDVVMTDYGYR